MLGDVLPLNHDFKQVDQGDRGTLVVSLDFELFWGVRDKLTKQDYEQSIKGVQTVVPTLLELFQRYGIHATWAVVGLLYLNNKEEALAELPARKPSYKDPNLSPYPYIASSEMTESEDVFHFSPHLIQMVSSYPYQEIGTHTFSHYYCLEEGQTVREFEEDLKKSIAVAKRFGLQTNSMVFPRNQVNQDYLPVCEKWAITSYRGNESSWFYQSMKGDDRRWIKRGIRLLDAYIRLSGHNSYRANKVDKEIPLNLPSSRFLRPYSKRFKSLESLRLKRILSDLTYAAQKGEVYHLWWHPHNFGVDLDENILFLQKIFEHYSQLQRDYGMNSMNMDELSRQILA